MNTWAFIFIVLIVFTGPLAAQEKQGNSVPDSEKTVEPASQQPERYPQARQIIERVMQQDDLKREVTDYRWVLKNRKDEEPDQPFDFSRFFLSDDIVIFLAFFAKFILWGAVIFLVILAYKYRALITPYLKNRRPDKTADTQVFAIKPEHESPCNDLEQFSRLYQSGKYRQAMSYLYHWIYYYLDETHKIQFSHGSTENELLAQAESLEPALASLLSESVTQWINTAYRHQPVTEQTCKSLHAKWQEAISR